MIAAFAPSFNRLRAALRRAPACPLASPLDVLCPLKQPQATLPTWVAHDPVVRKYRALLDSLPWADFPERPTDRPWPGPDPDPRAPFVAAFLIKLNEGKRFMSDLRAYLLEHPALVYWLGFERVHDPSAPHGFDLTATVPKRRHLSTVLRTLSNDAAQFLLTASVELLRDTLSPADQVTFGDTIALDTQALLAWVAENNPKQYIKEGRLDKDRQPKGDPDCALGVKKGRTKAKADPDDIIEAQSTPASDAKPASRLQVGVDILWGYGAGVVATRLPDGTEVVLAERTCPFNESDVSYFKPLMAQVEQRLGRKPKYGALDTAFDAHYVYDYFDQAGGFAAVPLNPGKRGNDRQFDAQGRPLCAAGLAMSLKLTYLDRTSGLEPYTREKYACPLLHPEPTGAVCPIADPHWDKGGCTTTIAASRGARIRLQLDREGAAYKQLYAKRTIVERINSQAEALGILRPKLRRGSAITNRNTLLYVLINLRALARLRGGVAEASAMLTA
jgi:hypothetical protein